MLVLPQGWLARVLPLPPRRSWAAPEHTGWTLPPSCSSSAEEHWCAYGDPCAAPVQCHQQMCFIQPINEYGRTGFKCIAYTCILRSCHFLSLLSKMRVDILHYYPRFVHLAHHLGYALSLYFANSRKPQNSQLLKKNSQTIPILQ